MIPSVRIREICLSLMVLSGLSAVLSAAERPNFLIVTVDDMSCDSVGAFGCRLPDTTPNIDRLAAEGLRYHYAHVQVGNCFPSRNVMFSGRYPHNTGVEGFYQVKDATHPHLVDLMKDAGYFVGIRGKVSHSTPYQPYGWDADLTDLDGEKQAPKNIESYYASTRRGIELAKRAGKPYCLNINISDPHKPFYAMQNNGKVVADSNVPSRVFRPNEVPIPGFLFDHPAVRLELAHYYSSVRRADDCFGAVIKALDEVGNPDNTVILFLSDHGMPLPFAKTALWHHSTRTPWIVKWPGVTEPGSVDRTHMISAVDLLPTVLDIAGIESPGGFDGHSFLPTLRRQTQPDRERVYKVYNENSGANRSPMRGVQSKQYLYLFNPWSDGTRIFRTATTGTITYRTMQQLAADNPQIAERLKFFKHGAPEEFYDVEADPDALNNLIDDPDYAEQIEEHRQAMKRFMTDSGDHALPAFEHRDDPAFVSVYVDKVQAEAAARRKNRNQNRNASRPRPNARLFTLSLPKQASPGTPFAVTINHNLPPAMGSQLFHVTLKDAAGKRLARIVKSAAGKGTLTVEFPINASIETNQVNVATFVGKDFQSNRLLRAAGPVPVKR